MTPRTSTLRDPWAPPDLKLGGTAHRALLKPGRQENVGAHGKALAWTTSVRLPLSDTHAFACSTTILNSPVHSFSPSLPL